MYANTQYTFDATQNDVSSSLCIVDKTNGLPKGYVLCKIESTSGETLMEKLLLKTEGCSQCEALDDKGNGAWNKYRYPVLKGARCTAVTKTDCTVNNATFCPGSTFNSTDGFYKVKTGKCVSSCQLGTCVHYKPGYLEDIFHYEKDDECITEKMAKQNCKGDSGNWCVNSTDDPLSNGKCVTDCDGNCNDKNIVDEMSPEPKRCVKSTPYNCRNDHSYKLTFWEKKPSTFAGDKCAECRAQFIKEDGCYAVETYEDQYLEGVNPIVALSEVLSGECKENFGLYYGGCDNNYNPIIEECKSYPPYAESLPPPPNAFFEAVIKHNRTFMKDILFPTFIDIPGSNHFEEVCLKNIEFPFFFDDDECANDGASCLLDVELCELWDFPGCMKARDWLNMWQINSVDCPDDVDCMGADKLIAFPESINIENPANFTNDANEFTKMLLQAFINQNNMAQYLKDGDNTVNGLDINNLCTLAKPVFPIDPVEGYINKKELQNENGEGFKCAVIDKDYCNFKLAGVWCDLQKTCLSEFDAIKYGCQGHCASLTEAKEFKHPFQGVCTTKSEAESECSAMNGMKYCPSTTSTGAKCVAYCQDCFGEVAGVFQPAFGEPNGNSNTCEPLTTDTNTAKSCKWFFSKSHSCTGGGIGTDGIHLGATVNLTYHIEHAEYTGNEVYPTCAEWDQAPSDVLSVSGPCPVTRCDYEEGFTFEMYSDLFTCDCNGNQYTNFCPHEELVDFTECFFNPNMDKDNWHSDGFCDNGISTYISSGHPQINFNCSKFHLDGGDCHGEGPSWRRLRANERHSHPKTLHNIEKSNPRRHVLGHKLKGRRLSGTAGNMGNMGNNQGGGQNAQQGQGDMGGNYDATNLCCNGNTCAGAACASCQCGVSGTAGHCCNGDVCYYAATGNQTMCESCQCNSADTMQQMFGENATGLVTNNDDEQKTTFSCSDKYGSYMGERHHCGECHYYNRTHKTDNYCKIQEDHNTMTCVKDNMLEGCMNDETFYECHNVTIEDEYGYVIGEEEECFSHHRYDYDPCATIPGECTNLQDTMAEMAQMQEENGHFCGSALVSNNHTCPSNTTIEDAIYYDDSCAMSMPAGDWPQDWKALNASCWDNGNSGCHWWNGTGTGHCAGGYCYSNKYTPADGGC